MCESDEGFLGLPLEKGGWGDFARNQIPLSLRDIPLYQGGNFDTLLFKHFPYSCISDHDFFLGNSINERFRKRLSNIEYIFLFDEAHLTVYLVKLT